MAIVNPYTSHDSIRNLPYRNLWPNKSTIIDFTYREEFAQLVLSKGDKVMSVDTVRRDVIDFVMLKVSGRVNGVEILKRSQVKNLIYTRNLVTMGKYIPVLNAPLVRNGIILGNNKLSQPIGRPLYLFNLTVVF